jgi:metal transporter CNNM
VLVNSSSTLILGSYLDGLFAAVGATFFIVLFGEIIPQSVCSRYGLWVGSYTRFITYTFMVLTFPLSYPLSRILDYFLGKQTAATYTREKVRELMTQANIFEDKEKKFISGALDFKNKCINDVMVPINEVFTLDIHDVLDYDTFQKIALHGYSRIPVYEHTR